MDIARTDVATVFPEQPMREAQSEMMGSDIDLCLVLNERGVLLGRVDGMPEGAHADAPVADVMRLAPGTTKPEAFLHDVVDNLRGTRFGRTILTAREPHEAGRYLGVLLLSDAERVLKENANLGR
jgi:CBS domain-containing protein